ncbi:MAG: hypothetical protein LBB08_00655, partial [Rickettsiales bacterium]|nr:hypothetical protein [Rickettsiales bacterium]
MAGIRQDFDGTPLVSLSPQGSIGGVAAELREIGPVKIKAFYDASHKLLFVLDITHDDILPNALLVVDARGGRKWDDILKSDFGVEPESVRPRKNNK